MHTPHLFFFYAFVVHCSDKLEISLETVSAEM